MEASELDACPIWTDLKTFNGKPFRGLVDIISGGFPCTPFSCAGLQKGDDDPRHLFPSILNVIRDTQPRVVFLENVEGIISAKLKGDQWSDPAGTPVLLHVLRELERVGYRSTAGVFSAAEVGAPHQRKRVFILANRNESRLERRHSRIMPECSEQLPVGQGSPQMEWPSRPGSQQHEWEEPRTVGNTDISRKRSEEPGDDGQVLGVQEDQGQEHSASVSGGASGELADAKEHDRRHLQERSETLRSEQQSRRQIKSKLDRATDGTAGGVDATANRVDRLRLIGNGVVPDTCETALRALLDELN